MSTKATATADTNAFADLGDALGSAADRFEAGAAEARESAKRAAGKAQHAARVGLYNVAYGISYGLVYTTVFLTELLPSDSAFRQGLEEGADSAFEARSLKEIEAGAEQTEEEEAEEEAVTAVTSKHPARSRSTVQAKKAVSKKV